MKKFHHHFNFILHGVIITSVQSVGKAPTAQRKMNLKLNFNLTMLRACLPLVSASDGAVCLKDAAQPTMSVDGEKNHMRAGQTETT